ncbi:BQ2448_2630 [Microbotryum intermedium]|uniref:BQ2448_2630 protein n=1 Tax=Microbotryum intermedium TaxID=269621 RepID=A0A238F6X5_9BASI|nr:BQ2448_2630 [Microbotryum intermedium]
MTPPRDPSSPQEHQQDQQGQQLQLPISPGPRPSSSTLDFATALLEPPLRERRATLEAPAPIMLAPRQTTTPVMGEAPLPPSVPASTTTFADDITHDSTKLYGYDLESSPLASKTLHGISHSDHDPLGGGGARVTVDHSTGPLGEGTPVRLEFLLLSGKRMRLSIGDKTSIQRTRELVWQRWPPEWSGPEEFPPSTQSLRLKVAQLMQRTRALVAYGIGTSEGANPTVVHLNVRPLSLSKSESSPAVKKEAQSEGCCGCIIG